MSAANSFASLLNPTLGYLGIYWIVAGAACLLLFSLLNKTSEHTKQLASKMTPLTRSFFYFIFGGALLPMALLILLSLVPASVLGEIQEKRWRARAVEASPEKAKA